MGILADGMAMLAQLQVGTDGVTVTYTRPGKTGFTVAAVIGQTVFDQSENTDIPIRTANKVVDFIIRVSDLETAIIGAGYDEFKPADGDKISRTVTILGASTTAKYRVYSDGIVPAWDWGEPEQLTYRIHTRAEK